MRQLARVLMLAGAALVSIGLLGRFALGEGEAASGPTALTGPTGPTGPTAVTGPTGPTSPVAEPSPSPVPAPELESPEEFWARWADAARSDDDAFLVARLHPAVLEIYGRRQCLAQVATLGTAEGFDVEVRRVRGPEPYDYAPDGRSVTIPEAYAVALTFRSSTDTSRQKVHVAPVADELRWFTDCGEPLA